MTYERKILTLGQVLASGLANLRATRRETLWILSLGLVLPQLVVSLVFDTLGVQVASELESLAAASQATGPFETLVGPALTYMGRLVPTLLVASLVMLVSYLALVHLAVRHFQGQPPSSPLAALGLGLKTALPRGIMASLAVLLLVGFLGQLFVPPVLVVVALSLALPVILVTEHLGIFRSLRLALSLRYARQGGYSGLNVLIALGMLATALYAASFGVMVLADTLLHLDEHLGLSRAAWTWTLPGLDFGPVYLGVLLMETVALMSLLAVCPAMTTALYFIVAGRREIAQA